jgi:hypothetical protein
MRESFLFVVATLVVASIMMIGCGGGSSTPTEPKPQPTPGVTPTPVPVQPMITLVAATPASGATVSARNGLVVRVQYVTNQASSIGFAVITDSGVSYSLGIISGYVDTGSGIVDISAIGTPDMPGITTTQIKAYLYNRAGTTLLATDIAPWTYIWQ